MKLLLLCSLLILGAACSSPKEKYEEKQAEAKQDYDEDLKEAEEEYTDDQKDESKEYVDESDSATVDKDNKQINVVE